MSEQERVGLTPRVAFVSGQAPRAPDLGAALREAARRSSLSRPTEGQAASTTARRVRFGDQQESSPAPILAQGYVPLAASQSRQSGTPAYNGLPSILRPATSQSNSMTSTSRQAPSTVTAQIGGAVTNGTRPSASTGVVTTAEATIEGFTVVRRLGPVSASATCFRHPQHMSTTMFDSALERACAEAMDIVCEQVVRGGGNAVLSKRRQVRPMGCDPRGQIVIVSGTAAVVRARADAQE